MDLVGGDFNGAAWRRDNRNNISTIEEAFADCALPMSPSPTPLWGPGSVPGNWADVCRFLKPLESDRQWKVRLHGALSFLRDVLGCHREACLHLDCVEWHDIQLQREKLCQRILLKERSSPYHYGKKSGRTSDIMTDHLLSSCHRDHSRTLVRRPASRVLRASSPSDLMTLPTHPNRCTCLVHSFCKSFTLHALPSQHGVPKK